MRRLLQPTLQRRVLLAMSLAFVLVWLALVVYGVHNGADAGKREKLIRSLGALVCAQVSEFEDAAQAIAFIGGVERLQNAIFRTQDVPAALLLVLWDKQGRLVYASEQADPVALRGDTANINEVSSRSATSCRCTPLSRRRSSIRSWPASTGRSSSTPRTSISRRSS